MSTDRLSASSGGRRRSNRRTSSGLKASLTVTLVSRNLRHSTAEQAPQHSSAADAGTAHAGDHRRRQRTPARSHAEQERLSSRAHTQARHAAGSRAGTACARPAWPAPLGRSGISPTGKSRSTGPQCRAGARLRGGGTQRRQQRTAGLCSAQAAGGRMQLLHARGSPQRHTVDVHRAASKGEGQLPLRG